MSNISRQRVRYTGKRTGMEAMSIQGFGIVSKGQTIELDSEVAERWAEPLPAAGGEILSDWTLVGDEIERTPEEALEADWKQKARLIEHAFPATVEIPDEATVADQESPKVESADKNEPAKLVKDSGPKP